MTTPNKFESAARLLKALQRLADRRREKVADVEDRYATARESLLAAADPEVRKMVEAEDD